MVSEKFSFKTRHFTKNVWLINFFATQQFRSCSSFNIAFNKLKIAQIAQLNQLFQLLHLVHMCGHGFYELSRMLMRKNVNSDVSKDLPMEVA